MIGRTLSIARRELGAYLCAASSYLVAALFLLVQGYSFWLYTSVLNERYAPRSWPLRYFFGGSFLFWLFMMFIAAVLTMRLWAEERRQGTIEPLLTAPVRPVEAMLGKYLGVIGFYISLWLPTLLYVVVLDRVMPGRGPQGLDYGPILGAYLGTLLIGASSLALGLWASTSTVHQLLACVASFLVLMLVLLMGSAAAWAQPGSTLRAVLDHIHLLHQMEGFARGLIDSRPLVLHTSVIVFVLWTATRQLGWPAAAPSARRRSLLEIALLAAVVGLANMFAAAHPLRWDWTRGQANTLSPRTEAILGALTGVVTAHVLMLPTGQPEDAYPLVRDLLALMETRSVRFHVDLIDPDREADRVRTLAEHFGMSGDELADGAVVFELQEANAPATPTPARRSQYVPRRELVDTEIDGDGNVRLTAFKGEAAFGGALVQLTTPGPAQVCFTRGHGELPIDSLAVDGMSDWRQALLRSGLLPRTIDSLTHGVPADCSVTVIAGAERPLAQAELAALMALLEQGGRLLVLQGPVIDAATLTPARIGLEPLLGRYGVSLGDGVVFDPAVEMASSALAWAVDQGYGDHPITASLLGRRTVWALTRALIPLRDRAPGMQIVELVTTSERAWEERDLDTVFRDTTHLGHDPVRESSGPFAVALAVSAPADARLVVLGSKVIARNDHDVFYNRDLLEQAVIWLDGRRRPLPIAPVAPAALKLALSEQELTRIFWVCVVLLPLSVLLIGSGVWWRRRA